MRSQRAEARPRVDLILKALPLRQATPAAADTVLFVSSGVASRTAVVYEWRAPDAASAAEGVVAVKAAAANGTCRSVSRQPRRCSAEGCAPRASPARVPPPASRIGAITACVHPMAADTLTSTNCCHRSRSRSSATNAVGTPSDAVDQGVRRPAATVDGRRNDALAGAFPTQALIGHIDVGLYRIASYISDVLRLGLGPIRKWSHERPFRLDVRMAQQDIVDEVQQFYACRACPYTTRKRSSPRRPCFGCALNAVH